MHHRYYPGAPPPTTGSIPPWKYVITHARDTGYNPHGICVPKLKYFEFDWVVEASNRQVGSGRVVKGRPLFNFLLRPVGRQPQAWHSLALHPSSPFYGLPQAWRSLALHPSSPFYGLPQAWRRGPLP